jgi:hypothetical protein
MTIRSVAAPYLLGAVVGLMASVSTVVHAQQPANSSKSATGNPIVLHGAQGGKAGAQKSSKRTAPKPRATASQQPSVQVPPQKEWSLEDALPTRRSDAGSRRETPTMSTPQLGRIPLESGTFGFETETKVKSNELSDGRRVPGLETDKRDPPSYFGLSLSVPTNNKSLVPVPILPPWGRD